MSETLFYRDDAEQQESAARRIFTVSEITRDIKLSLEDHFQCVWIEGEVSNLKKHSSGHWYFSLKDAEAQISCVMWRGRNQYLRFHPEDGMKVRTYGNLTVYERQGRYQIDVHQIQPAGVGELQMAFEALKQQLNQEGLFDPDKKKPIPEYPQKIGIVTSPTGAAIRDIISVLERRFPSVEPILIPVRVQGDQAAGEIAQAISDFNEYGEVDVLIVGRGGGSLEDLWPFNEEIVARHIFASKIPVISAVGHEIDFSISDFVADVRAPTPSVAAEIAVQSRTEMLERVNRSMDRLVRSIEDRIQYFRNQIEGFEKSYAFRWPQDRIREFRLRLDDVSKSMETAISHQFDTLRLDVKRLQGKMISLSPLEVLKRGYSITTRLEDDSVIREPESLSKSELLRTRFANGSIISSVEAIEEA